MIKIHPKNTTVDRSGIDSAREVLLYDHSVADVKVLLAGLKPDCGRLPLNGLPVESLVAAISSPHLRVLHILCHGAPGRILIDGVTYSNELFEVAAANASASSEFFQGRAVDGERQIQINFWSCNVGHGEQGMRFLNKVSSAMNAQVNASQNKVGSEDLGGSWELSAQAAVPFSTRAMDEFSEVLIGASDVKGVFDLMVASVMSHPLNTLTEPQAKAVAGETLAAQLVAGNLEVDGKPYNVAALLDEVVPASAELPVMIQKIGETLDLLDYLNLPDSFVDDHISLIADKVAAVTLEADGTIITGDAATAFNYLTGLDNLLEEAYVALSAMSSDSSVDILRDVLELNGLIDYTDASAAQTTIAGLLHFLDITPTTVTDSVLSNISGLLFPPVDGVGYDAVEQKEFLSALSDGLTAVSSGAPLDVSAARALADLASEAPGLLDLTALETYLATDADLTGPGTDTYLDLLLADALNAGSGGRTVSEALGQVEDVHHILSGLDLTNTFIDGVKDDIFAAIGRVTFTADEVITAEQASALNKLTSEVTMYGMTSTGLELLLHEGYDAALALEGSPALALEKVLTLGGQVDLGNTAEAESLLSTLLGLIDLTAFDRSDAELFELVDQIGHYLFPSDIGSVGDQVLSDSYRDNEGSGLLAGFDDDSAGLTVGDVEKYVDEFFFVASSAGESIISVESLVGEEDDPVLEVSQIFRDGTGVIVNQTIVDANDDWADGSAASQFSSASSYDSAVKITTQANAEYLIKVGSWNDEDAAQAASGDGSDGAGLEYVVRVDGEVINAYGPSASEVEQDLKDFAGGILAIAAGETISMAQAQALVGLEASTEVSLLNTTAFEAYLLSPVDILDPNNSVDDNGIIHPNRLDALLADVIPSGGLALDGFVEHLGDLQAVVDGLSLSTDFIEKAVDSIISNVGTVAFAADGTLLDATEAAALNALTTPQTLPSEGGSFQASLMQLLLQQAYDSALSQSDGDAGAAVSKLFGLGGLVDLSDPAESTATLASLIDMVDLSAINVASLESLTDYVFPVFNSSDYSSPSVFEAAIQAHQAGMNALTRGLKAEAEGLGSTLVTDTNALGALTLFEQAFPQLLTFGSSSLIDDQAVGTVSTTGDFKEGGVVIASASVTDPDGATTTSYQWQSSADNGVNWIDIPGATSPSFSIPGDESLVGDQLRAEVTTTDSGALSGQTTFYTTPSLVQPVNDAPAVTGAITKTVLENATPDLVVDLLENASDVDDLSSALAVETVTYTVGGIPTSGDGANVPAGVVYANGKLTVDTDAFDSLAQGEVLEIVASYNVVDDSTGSEKGSVAQTATIKITGANDGPTVSAAIAPASVTEDTSSFTQSLLANASDADQSDTLDISDAGVSYTLKDGSAATFSYTGSTPPGVSLSGTDLTIDPTAYNGLAVGESRVIEASYSVVDGNGGFVAQTATFTITGANDAPTVSGSVESGSTNENTTFNGTLAAAGDVDTGATLTYHLVSGPGTDNGTVQVNTNGSYTFTPGTDFDDLDKDETVDVTFSYRVKDDHNAYSAEKTVTLTVTGTNDAPVISGGIALSSYVESDLTAALADAESLVASTGFSFSDVDGSGVVKTTTIEMIGNTYKSGQDELTIDSGLSGIDYGTGKTGFDSNTGALKIFLADGGTNAEMLAAIQSVGYRNTSETPDTSTRELRLTVDDGLGGTDSVTKTFSVTNSKENGEALSQEQLTSGDLITGDKQTLAGSSDTLDTSGISGDVIIQSGLNIMVDDDQDGSIDEVADFDSNGSFETFVTGSGSDFIVGPGNQSASFEAGDGNNVIFGGAGSDDKLVYGDPVTDASNANAAPSDVHSAEDLSLTVTGTGGSAEARFTPVLNTGTVVQVTLGSQVIAAQVASAGGLTALVSALAVEAERVGNQVTITEDSGQILISNKAGEDVVGTLSVEAFEFTGVKVDLETEIRSTNVGHKSGLVTSKFDSDDSFQATFKADPADGRDMFLNIEGVLGTAYGDILYGDSGVNNLSGLAGDDIIDGRGGNDVLAAGAGDNTVYGGDGDDTITAGDGYNFIDSGDGDDSITVGNGSNIIYAGLGNDTVIAGNGGNVIDAGAGNNTVTTGSGADDITTGSGNDTIVTGDGGDTVNAGDGTNSVTSGSGADNITTGSGNDTVSSGGGNDTIDSGSGNDTVSGGAGNDDIDAGAGDDTVIGGSGADTLTGGTGDDTFVADDDEDTVTDFEQAEILTSIRSGALGLHDQVLFRFDSVAVTGVAPDAVMSVSLTDETATSAKLNLFAGTTQVSSIVLQHSGLSAGYELNEFIASELDGSGNLKTTLSDFAVKGGYEVRAGTELRREAQIDDSAASDLIIGQGTDNDIILSDGVGGDILIGSAGDDVLEIRVRGTTDDTGAIDQGQEVIADLGNFGDNDSILIEGVRDLGDLVFARTTHAGEGDGQSLSIDYSQYRSVDDPETTYDESAGNGMLHATGNVTVFNQFSLSQSDLYAVEQISIQEEFGSTVSTYLFGEVTGQTTVSGGGSSQGDVISASTSSGDAILVGGYGQKDEFVINADGTSATIHIFNATDSDRGFDADDVLTINASANAQARVGTSDNIIEIDADGANGFELTLILEGAYGNINSTFLNDKLPPAFD